MQTNLATIQSQKTIRKQAQGGWITLPFIIGTYLGLGLAASGTTSNIIVYLMKEYNIKSVDAAQISNIINGCLNLAPIAGAILADAYFGCYRVVLFSTVVSLLAVIMFTLTATLPSLRPPPCSLSSNTCQLPSTTQLAVLYIAVALLTVGMGGTRFTISTMGANQFDKVAQKEVFFNWFCITLYTTMIVGSTVFVYIQDNISWSLGFGLTIAANVVALALLLLGARYYRKPRAEGSPFTSMARVFIAAMKKRMVVMSGGNLKFYSGTDESIIEIPTRSFGFFNRAAVITVRDASPWSLCTVQQVEDLKVVLRILPLWSSCVFVSISIGILNSLTVLQGLTMDRHLGPHFTLSASSILVVMFLSAIFFITILDRLVFPFLQSHTGHSLTLLQRIGFGQILNAMGFVTAAIVEHRRHNIVLSHNAESQPSFMVPMSALWLFLPLVVTGASEAMHFPAQVALYYQEFPAALRSTSTGLVATMIALGFYLSTVVVDVVRRFTDWLPDNINGSRLDNVYWLLSVLGAVNFGFYLLCACRYKYNNSCTDVVISDEGDERN